MKKFKVIGELALEFGTHTQKQSGSYRNIPVGAFLSLDQEADNGNVWFYTECGNRGKVAAGSLRNLINRGAIEEI